MSIFTASSKVFILYKFFLVARIKELCFNISKFDILVYTNFHNADNDKRYPADLSRRAKIDSVLHWHHSNLRAGAGA